MRDLIVAGGGPIGLATAIHAARAGLTVTVVEPRRGDIDKACGEGLMPGAVHALSQLGVPMPGRPIEGIRYLDDHRVAEARFRHGEGRGVRRTTLHRALRTAAAAAGVETVHESVRRVTQVGDHVVADGRSARFLVAADGLHSPVRRMLGLDGRPFRRRRYGLRCHVDVAPWSSFVEVYWTPDSEIYVTPVADNQVGIAVLRTGPGAGSGTETRSVPGVIAAVPRLVEHLADRTLSRVRGAGPLRQHAQRRVAGRVLLVGDAAGYVDALTGEGIALGLAQAEAAVRAILLEAPQRYETQARRLGRRHDLLTRGLLGATSLPTARRHLVALAAAVPSVFESAVNQLARPT